MPEFKAVCCMNAIFPFHYVRKLEFRICHHNSFLISFEMCILGKQGGPNEFHFIDRFFPIDFVILKVIVSNKFISVSRSFP